MYFKPRIFISSTFDLIPLRKRINDIFQQSGAEIMLYELNLTPSTLSVTYRKDIQEADFIIFILDTRYGNKANDSGLSGTHEEWKIASQYKIPCHVYIKHVSNKEKELVELIEELNNSGVSFYYYKDTNDLLKRMKGTIFTVAKEIAMSQVDKLSLSRKDILRHSINHDYIEAMKLIKLVESIIRNLNRIDINETTIFFDLLDRLTYIYEYDKNRFVEQRLNSSFEKLVIAYNKASSLHTSIYTSKSGQRQKIYFDAIDEEVTYSHLSYNGEAGDREKVHKNFEEFFQVYEELKELVLTIRGEVDSL